MTVHIFNLYDGYASSIGGSISGSNSFKEEHDTNFYLSTLLFGVSSLLRKHLTLSGKLSAGVRNIGKRDLNGNGISSKS